MENPQQGLKECSQVVDSLTEKFDRIAIADGLALLLKLLGNIAKHPGDVKYRKIKTTNKTLASRVFSLRGIESILTALGFSLQGEFYVYNAQPVQHIQNATIILSAREMQLRAVRTSQVSAAEAELRGEIEAKRRKDACERKRLMSGMNNDRSDFNNIEKDKVYEDSKGKKLKFGADVVTATEALGLDKQPQGGG